MINPVREETLNLNDNWLCLDFVNTVGWHASSKPEEKLHSYADLINWSLKKGLVSADEANLLGEQAALRPESAQTVLKQGIELREAIYRIFLASINNEAAQTSDLDLLNSWITVGSIHLKLEIAERGFAWNWKDNNANLDAMLWWAALSAGRLLASENLALVGECADEGGCGWLFFDTSKNHSRRWCAMNDCGNRAKSRRHYEKITGSQTG
ncbi:MAG: CGNR zinc finger domain-containing protein [Anaerolineaceae bacterium]|nr:CGNR zinc finger domain-containing protein [Anaerolineaceae bacterium]